MPEPLEISVEGRVATLRLARPAKRNALNLELKLTLGAALADLGRTPGLGAVVLTGQGPAFCAGADLADLPAASGAAYREYLRGLQRDVIEPIVASPLCFVAAVNGPAVGGGLSLALACDIVVAAESASFSAAFPALGLAPDLGAAFLLARSMGLHRARAMLLLGESLDGRGAYAAGLAHEVVADGEVVEAAQRLAARVAGFSRWAVDATKRLTLAGATSSLAALLDEEASAQALLRLTDEHVDAVAHFLASRRPPP